MPLRPSCMNSGITSISTPTVMTVRLGLLFFLSIYSPILSPCYYCTTDTLPSLLDTVLSWIYHPIPRLEQDALRTVHLLPYLLHALPLPLLYYLRVHQYLLMCTLCAPFVPLRCLPLLIATLCTTAPFVHTSGPPYMCNTMPLVRILVV